MKFESHKIEKLYWTYRNYLEKRCEALPRQIEKKFKNLSTRHESSSCYGMSNYIEVTKLDDDENDIDWLKIRISDHRPVFGGICDKYIYIQDYTWTEIKKIVFEIITEFYESKVIAI